MDMDKVLGCWVKHLATFHNPAAHSVIYISSLLSFDKACRLLTPLSAPTLHRHIQNPTHLLSPSVAFLPLAASRSCARLKKQYDLKGDLLFPLLLFSRRRRKLKVGGEKGVRAVQKERWRRRWKKIIQGICESKVHDTEETWETRTCSESWNCWKCSLSYCRFTMETLWTAYGWKCGPIRGDWFFTSTLGETRQRTSQSLWLCWHSILPVRFNEKNMKVEIKRKNYFSGISAVSD